MTDLKILHQHAVLALQSGDLVRADALIGQLQTAQPAHPLVNYLLGALRFQQGRSAEAIGPLEIAHRAKPDNVSVLLHMGNALQELKRFDEAVMNYDLALKLKPDFADALSNRGNALGAQKQFTAALASFDAALALDSTDAGFWYNRGSLLQKMSRFEEAIACFDRALTIRPAFTEAISNKGNALVSLRRPDMALPCFEQALALKPKDTASLMNHAVALVQLDRFADALADYDKIAAIKPDYPRLFGQMALAALYDCDWDRMAKLGPEIPAQVKAGIPGLDPWTLMGYGADGPLLLNCARNALRETVTPQAPLWTRGAYHHDRIRLAYISPDFRSHPVGFQLVQVIEQHDRSRFEVIGISSGEDDGSEIRVRLAGAFDEFHNMADRSDMEVADRLRELEIDIAVDLSGHTYGHRLGAFAARPAPVQAAWLGFPGTTGADFMDFILGDAVVTPPAHQAFYSEKIVALPGSFFPLDRDKPVGTALTRTEAGLPENGFVFCCFNRNWKITPQLFDIWLRLLQQVPGSVLWLRDYAPNSNAALQRRAGQRGIDPARLIFADRAPLDIHLARHGLADLFLDTLPYGAHATAADALWAGLPVLTQLGEMLPGRVGASLLTAAGLPELITHTPEEYEATALSLAHDPARLKALRQKLAANRATAPLFDTVRFTRGLEAAYEAMLDEKR